MVFREPIAIIAAGCLLPCAVDISAYWRLLISGKNQFRKLAKERFHPDVFLSPEFNSPDTSYSDQAAFVDDSSFFSKEDPLPRGHQMLLKALKEAVDPLPNGYFSGKKIQIILGCMNPEDLSAESLLKAEQKEIIEAILNQGKTRSESLSIIEKQFEDLFGNASTDPSIHYPSSLGTVVHDFLKTHGPAYCADSACASSLTAIELAALTLDSRETDLVISGGVESNLGIETYVPFSHLGVLSRNQCLPYDERTDGIVQGEGAVVFILKRLSDALKAKLPIWGVIEGISSSSNGSKASLFSPSFESQKRIFDGLNQELGQSKVHYVEGHGTGTPVGDLAELTALRDAFSSAADPIYLGSVKSLIGHTKGAAGAAGLLKCLLAIKHRTIPPSPYFKQTPLREKSKPFLINSTAISVGDVAEPLRMRVCSAGFGGANYHLAIREFQGEMQGLPQTVVPQDEICLVGFSQVSFNLSEPQLKGYSWKIPPNLLSNLDTSQVYSLLALEKAIESSLISFERLDKTQICIISASHTRTTKIENLTRNLQLKKLEKALLVSHFPEAALIKNYRSSLITLDETSCQSLNSMTSGRVANEFDLQGCNFHLDADFSSLPVGIKVAELLLRNGKCQMVILFNVGESTKDNPILISREAMSCWIFSTKRFSQNQMLPMLGTLDTIEYL